MSSPLKANHAKSSSFVWNDTRTRLINTAAITLPYYATSSPSQLPCSRSLEVPNLKDDIEIERGCSLAQSSPSLILKADASPVNMSVTPCIQLATGLGTDTTQTPSRLKLKPELSSQQPRLGLTTRSSQSVSNTHNQQTYAFDDGSLEVPTFSVSQLVPQGVPTFCGNLHTIEQGGSDLLAHAQQDHAAALESGSQAAKHSQFDVEAKRSRPLRLHILRRRILRPPPALRTFVRVVPTPLATS